MSNINEKALIEIFKSVLSITAEAEIVKAEFGATDGWDSFSHMSLIIEIEERLLRRSIPSADIPKLLAFSSILQYIDRELERLPYER
jgi:acyl carrier protein